MVLARVSRVWTYTSTGGGCQPVAHGSNIGVENGVNKGVTDCLLLAAGVFVCGCCGISKGSLLIVFIVGHI